MVSHELFACKTALVIINLYVLCLHSLPHLASPITTPGDNGVKHNVLRRLHTPYSQYNALFTSLSTETGLQTGTNSETLTSGNREASSIIYHQSSPLPFTQGSFSYNQNTQDNKRSRAGITGVLSEVRPASSIFASHSQHGGQSSERLQSRVNNLPLFQEVARSGNSYHSYPVIIRKSSHKGAASPFHQRSRPSQVWEPKDAPKSYTEEKVPREDSPKVAEDETVWQPSRPAIFSARTGGYRSSSLPTSRGHYSGYKETNVLTVAGPSSTSNGIQSSNFLSFASQTAPRAPSVSNSFDASVIKSNASPEKLTSSITDFSQGFHPVSSSEAQKHKKARSYLFIDAQTSLGGHEAVKTVAADGPSAFPTTPHQQRPSDAQVQGRFSSNFKQLQRSQSRETTKEVQHLSDYGNALYHDANVAQHGAQTDSFTRYQRTTAETQMSLRPVPRESFAHTPHADFQGKHATGSEKSVVSSQVNATRRGLMLANKPGQTIKSVFGLRGFQNPMWRAVKEPSILSPSGSNERINSQRYSFDKGKFKIANIYPSLSPKYSFGQRKASTTPSKPERTPTGYSSPSPGTADIGHTGTTARPFTPLMDSNSDPRQFRIYRRMYGLKGFGTRPLEGAKPLVGEPEKSDRVQQSFEGFKPRSSQIWRPKSSKTHKWNNKPEPGSSHETTVSPNERSSEDLKPLLKTEGGTEVVTRLTPGKYNEKNRSIDPLVSNKTPWRYKEQNPTAASASHRIFSSYLRSAGDLKVESSTKSEPRTPNRARPVVMKASLLSSSTSSVVRGKRVKGKHTSGEKLGASPSLTSEAGNAAIVRRPARVKAVTYADVLGSASFSGARATAHTPIAPADRDSNTTAATFSSKDAVHGDDTSRGPGAHAEDEGKDFSRAEENKLGVRSEGADSDMKASDLFLDDEGSGSGAFNMSDVFSTHATKSQGLSEDLLELDYLRVSTGNISFQSMKLSHTEK